MLEWAAMIYDLAHPDFPVDDLEMWLAVDTSVVHEALLLRGSITNPVMHKKMTKRYTIAEYVKQSNLPSEWKESYLRLEKFRR